MSLVKAIKNTQRKGLFPVISEIKLRSEKKGDLIKNRDPLDILKEMLSCPVSGISVVTESEHFGGSMDLLKKIIKNTSVPVLHKDFIKDEEQIKESSKIGASAILLISSILSKKELENLVETGKRCGIETMVEVHTLEDINKIQDIDTDILGINNRDIKILETDDTGVELTLKLIKYCPKDKPIISESSISTANDVIKVKKAGVDAVLVGTMVMLSDNINNFLNNLIYIG